MGIITSQVAVVAVGVDFGQLMYHNCKYLAERGVVALALMVKW